MGIAADGKHRDAASSSAVFISRRLRAGSPAGYRL